MKSRSRRGKFLRRLRRDADKGSAALEFAFVAPVFFVLLMGTIEAGIVFFAQATLQNAINEAGRMVRTGQVQTTSMSQADFRNKVCGLVSPLMACDSKLLIDVESFSNYGGVNYGSPLNGNGTLNAGLNNFSTGVPCSVVLVRGFYTWPVFTPGLNWFLANMAGNYHLLSAASAFRNEPYTNNVAGC
jgi:Flp pilus assembly protein TadG